METSNLRHQVMATNPLEEVLCCPTLQPQQQQQQERKPRPPSEQALSCPRCNSINTKFCYYNNYSLSQPRYFCKGCRRYWTKGGTLRNVPVGGGCRKNKRSSSSSKKAQDQNLPTSFGALLPSLPPPPPLMFDPHDLSLAFSTLHKAPVLDGHGDQLALGNASPNPIPPQAPSFLDIMRTGFFDSSMSSFDDMYYGVGGHHSYREEGGAGGERAMAVTPFEGLGGATSFTKQESSCKSTAEGDNRLFMGQQWQVGGDGGMVVDPARDYWNGVSPGWHGLVNSSLI